MSNFHTPALLKEAIGALNVQPNGKYIDATVGGGGHTQKILELGGRVLGIDQDLDAVSYVKNNLGSYIEDSELRLAVGNFSEISKIARDNAFEQVDGILFDLGVSSYQIDASGRGFSFSRPEDLDMRMSQDLPVKARDIVNKASFDELYEIISKFGEEQNAKAISENIVKSRSLKPINTSLELAQVIKQSVKGQGQIHPATRTFQALRIAVNSEIDNLKKGLEGAFEVLKPGGFLAVISFHSLEDRVVKLFFAKLSRDKEAQIVNKKPIVATEEEIRINRRARSAKLRIIKKYE